MLLTRRRHGLPPQPRQWFRNLADCFGDALKIRIALKDDRPLAAIVTLQHKEAMVYKYGCSDPDYNNLGGTHMVMWKAISDAKCQGLGTFDFGRSDFPNEGLMTFKDRWGSTRSTLCHAERTAFLASAQASFDLPLAMSQPASSRVSM